MFIQKASQAALTATLIVTASAALAAGGGVTHSTPKKPLGPAQRYDGNVPIDMSHGRVGNNGTYGLSNQEYETLSTLPLTAPGLLAAPYPYEAKKDFVVSLADRLQFFQEAAVNLEERSAQTKPEAVQFSDQLLPKIKSLLERARADQKRAASANEKEWPAAEAAARSSFLALRTQYEQAVRSPSVIEPTAQPNAQ